MITRTVKQYKEVEIETYIADNGVEFATKEVCEEYEELIEKVSAMEIKDLEDMLPLDTNGNDIIEGEHGYKWYRLKGLSDFELLQQAYNNIDEPTTYPDIMCVEYDFYSGDNWGYLLSEMKKDTCRFWNNFGIEIDFKNVESKEE